MPVSEPVLRAVDTHRESFLAAQPFRHVMIEQFFEPSFAERLLTEFPRFDSALSTNESGKAGGKSVNTNIRSISPAYQQLYDELASREFLDFASRLSGIPDLLLDPKMFGGGTHENLHGQELDPHVDFNYDESRQLHRRLNLIVYLNKDWQTEWGGAIEIHSNPRRPLENRITGFDPLFNRCVMFETNEYSWHGFPKIQLPEDKRDVSRKSISIYLYTRTRPEEEIAPVHATFYVQRPLPQRMQPGYTLTADDVAELNRLLIRRDQWIEIYQKMELEKNAHLAESAAYVAMLSRRTHVPVTGYALVEGESAGLLGDGWASGRVELKLKALQPMTGIQLRGYRPENAPEANVRILVDGLEIAHTRMAGGFELEVKVSKAEGELFELTLLSDSAPGWAKDAGDDRDLAYILTELRAQHT